jgi:hypothetical protein
MGNGDLKTEIRTTAVFRSIDMSGVGNLHVEKGPKVRVELRLDSNLLPHYQTVLRNGILRLGFESGYAVTNITALEVRITMPDLDGLSLSGAANADITGGFRGDRLALTLTGSGAIGGAVEYKYLRIQISGAGGARLSGRAETLELDLSGAGTFDGKGFAAGEAAIGVSGTGNVTLRAERRLRATVSGVGTLRYYGDPIVEQRVSGVGKILRAGD